MRERMHTLGRWTAIAGVTVALGAAAQAQADGKSGAAQMGAPTTGTDKSATCVMDDAAKTKTVLEFLHASNASEIQTARFALQTSPSADVKALADHLLADHTDGDKKLVDLAKKKGIDLGSKASEKGSTDPIHAAVHTMDSKMTKELMTKSGAAFDAAFLGGEVAEHMLVLAVIEEGQKVAKDADVKGLLDEMHKSVSAHREHAAQLADKLKLTGKPVGGGPKSEKPEPKAGTGLHHHQDK